MIIFKTPDQIEKMRRSAQLVSKTLGVMAEMIAPGVTPLQLNDRADEYIRDMGGVPAFLGLYNYPKSIITSVNEQVVHGIPTDTPLNDGDIVGIDIGVLMDGYYGDHAYTFAVGNISEPKIKLLRITKECLDIGIAQFKLGNRIGDISYAIQQHAEKHHYGVVREMVGHGLGTQMHEAPEVPNYGKRGRGSKIKEGMTIAIEPMINMGTRHILQKNDGWTIVTADKKPSAHFEHNVAIANGQTEVLSTFSYLEKELAKKGSLIV